MSVFQGHYPPGLAKVLGHAKRLTKVLAEIERARPDAWSLGRAGELRGVVSLALADWRSGANDVEATGKAILSYVDTIHRGASKRLQCGVALACCAEDEVITAVAPEEWASRSGGDTGMEMPTLATSGPTRPAEWVDSAEILARLRDGLPQVEALAHRMARRVGSRHASLDDLRAFGQQGLLDAARAFDEGRGVPFDRWASLRIRNAMIDGVRRFGAIPSRARRRALALGEPERCDAGDSSEVSESSGRSPLAGLHVLSMDMGEVADSRGMTPEDLAEKAQLAARVRAIVARLPKQERALIEQSYFQGLTVEQVAASMGLSRSWAHRAHARAMATMQRALGDRGVPTGAIGATRDPRSSP
jgi:RNA polymerase sigma factor FliA